MPKAMKTHPEPNAVTVLMKLRAGVTRGDIRELSKLLERIGDPASLAHWKERGVECPGVYKYDDQYGDPVFYIP
jgi:hypothetical protein